MSLKRYDLIVIGSGSAASSVAPRCRKGGWTVAIIDSRPFGGTCVLRGCDPKKVLVGAADALHWGHRLNGRGIQPGGARIEWRELMAFKRTFADPVPEGQERWLREGGVDTFHGRATFVGRTAVRVGGDVWGRLRMALPSRRRRPECRTRSRQTSWCTELAAWVRSMTWTLQRLVWSEESAASS